MSLYNILMINWYKVSIKLFCMKDFNLNILNVKTKLLQHLISNVNNKE